MELGGRTGPRRSPLGAALSKQTLVNYMVYYITLYRRITPPLTTASLLGLWADFLQMYSKLRPSVYTAPTVSLSSPIILSHSWKLGASPHISCNRNRKVVLNQDTL